MLGPTLPASEEGEEVVDGDANEDDNADEEEEEEENEEESGADSGEEEHEAQRRGEAEEVTSEPEANEEHSLIGMKYRKMPVIRPGLKQLYKDFWWAYKDRGERGGGISSIKNFFGMS